MDDRIGIGNTKKQQLGKLLGLVATNLDIPENLRAEMVGKYDHLGAWIRNDNQELYRTDSEIYPQGSVRLGTCIPPITPDCGYDVDLVYLRRLGKDSISQEQLVERTGEQLVRYIEYRRREGKDMPKLVRRRRCWALNYSGRFHMDVLPALPDEEGTMSVQSINTSILLTDRQLRAWQRSNPKAYADWFRECERVAYEAKRASMAKAGNVEIEKIADDTVKTPLRISIQVLKRHRDIRYSGDPDDKPISVIITTLAATAYQNELEVYEALIGIIKRMEVSIRRIDGEWWIPNPVNPKENFADKWNEYPQRAERFFEWLAMAKYDMESLLEQVGLNSISEHLSKSLGSDVVERSIQRYGESIDKSHLRGELKMAAGSGLLNSSVGTTVERNTWYGD